MNKTYTRINWRNAPSEATALNETNLNKMDSAIDTIDDRVVAHDTRLDNAEYAIGQDEDNITALQNGKVDKEEGKGISTLQDIEVIPVTRKGAFVGSIRTQDQSGNWTNKDFYNQTEVDTSLSQSSTNPLQNRVIWQQLSNKADKSTVNTALAGKVDKVEGKGLCDKSEVSVELPSGTPVGEEIATVVLKGQDGSDAIAYPIYNGIEVDSALSSESENPVQNKAVTTELENKADIDGNYEDMAVGQLLSNTFEEDKAPYNFRTSGGTLEIGDREYDTLVGGTVAFNQLVKNGNFVDTSNWAGGSKASISVSNNECTVTLDAIPTYDYEGTIQQTLNSIKDHIYLSLYDIYVDKTSRVVTQWLNLLTTTVVNSGWNTVAGINKTNTDYARVRYGVASASNYGYAVGDTYKVRKCNLIDLTQMFGSTIADYIYSLEQSTTGSGVAYFRSLFPKDYYAYNAGQLMSVKALSHKMVGFNQWDEQWEVGSYNDSGVKTTDNSRIRSKYPIKVFGGMQYYFKKISWIFTYDINGKFIEKTQPSGLITLGNDVAYVNFMTNTNYGTTYNNDICINLHWDGERDGEYEAYSEHIYPLDSDLELRGIPKLDANNNLYYDGDTYESDGTVTRKYGVVDLGTLDWQKLENSSLTIGYCFIAQNLSTRKSANINMLTRKYFTADVIGLSNVISKYGAGVDKVLWSANGNAIYIADSAYSDKDTFKTALSGVYLVYELATPTTETADTFENPQLVDNWGTEEYTDSREVQIPVGHITKYPPDLKAKLESAPDSPASDGDYILRHNNGENSYVALTKELPSTPTTNGTYVLKATVSGGVATLSWVAE